jgi:hypothetical protein
MAADAITIIIPLAIAVFGALAGYFGRIAQKIEDRRDDIYLKELPAISSCLRSFINSFEIFRETGSFEQLNADISKIHDDVKDKIFSGNIILFDKGLYEQLLEFYKITERLNNIVDGIQNNKDADAQQGQMDLFRRRYADEKDYPYGNGLSINVRSTVRNVEAIEGTIKSKFDKYLPFSWKLVVLITIIGILLGIIEIFKLLEQ